MIRLAVEVRGGSLQFGDLFWLSDWNPDFPQDQILSLPDGYYHITVCTRRPELVILIENQGCCRAGIRRKDLTKADPPVYVAADQINDQRSTLCAGTLSGFLRAALAYEAVFAFPFHGDELMYWLTEEELETVRTGLEKQPFGLSGWLGMDMSFYSNASDNMAVIMDCGDLEVLYGAASEAGYKKLMEVMEGLGEAI